MTEQIAGTDGLLGHVVRLNVAVDRVLTQLTGASGISVADYLVLGVVRRAPDHRSAPTAICEVLGRTTGGMSLTLDRLETAGLIRRLPDPTDRRRVVVEATDLGIDLAKAVNANLHKWEDSLALGDAERFDLGCALGLLTAAIDAAPDLTAAPLP
ncbi:MAG: MarR family transcriptional regulator [Acidimicrobiales bacterium]